MKDCRDCKTYQDCIGKSWFHYGEIRYCPYQVVFIIENSEKLSDGNWPPKPEGSSYIDPGIPTGYSSEASFVKPVVIIAEVNKRLSKTGVHGKLLVAEIMAGLDLSPESRSALMYIKGWRRKRQTFVQWVKGWRRGKADKQLHQKVQK